MAPPSPTRLLHLPLLAPKPSPPLVSRRRRATLAARCGCATEAGGGGGSVVVEDDLYELLQVLPRDLRDNLQNEPRKDQLLEVILDLGRRPEARFLGDSGGQYLRDSEISQQELEEAQRAVGEFGGDNRAGIEGTLHRISAIRSRKGMVVGLTCRVGRAVTGHVDMVRDLLNYKESILFLGRPGVGKTTVMREIARVLADEFQKRVVIVDTSNEIGGDGDIPHAAIGGARRMQVAQPSMQHRVMIEAVENHMPEVVIVDEIGTEAEAQACRSIAERGVMLIGTAHGEHLANIIKNPTLSDLIGGVETVTLGDEEARARRSQKSILERKAPPTFPFLIEMRERHYWVTHRTERSVDMLLHGKKPLVERVIGINSKDLSSYITVTAAKELMLFIERDAESWLVHWLTSGSNCHCYISQQEIKRLSCMAKCALACYYMLVPTASVLVVAGLHMPVACICMSMIDLLHTKTDNGLFLVVHS
uniref:AAA+ ATPase domain-containing protein n=1 Tax=Oryza punctata TaxID=4537 RepID=A0A0E0MKN4_ORYPU